jgi:hypothetical protein
MGTPTQVTLGGLNLITPTTADTQFITSELHGWGSPASTLTPTQKPHSHGAWCGPAYLGPRHITITGWITGNSPDSVADAIDRLIGVCALEETTLEVTENGRTRWCRVRRTDEVIITRHTPGAVYWSVQSVAPDPRKYDTPEHGDTLLPVTSGGLTIPLTVPISINSVTQTGQVNLTNTGNIPGPVTVRIDGPVTAPMVTHTGGGKASVFSTNLVLQPGEWVDIDMQTRQVLANGQASRAGWVTRRGWCAFEPGPNTWSFTASTHNPTAKLTVTATSAWQ